MDKRRQILIEALRDKNESIRKLAADSLEKLEVRSRLDYLAGKISNGEMLEKIRAVYALTDIKGQKVVEVLTKAAGDPSEDVRAAAVRALGNTASTSALPALVKALKDPSAIVARTAVEAVGKFSDPRILGPLMHTLKNEDPGVVERALAVVGRIGDKRSENAMTYFAVKGNSKMRELAIKALGEMDT